MGIAGLVFREEINKLRDLETIDINQLMSFDLKKGVMVFGFLKEDGGLNFLELTSVYYCKDVEEKYFVEIKRKYEAVMCYKLDFVLRGDVKLFGKIIRKTENDILEIELVMPPLPLQAYFDNLYGKEKSNLDICFEKPLQRIVLKVPDHHVKNFFGKMQGDSIHKEIEELIIKYPKSVFEKVKSFVNKKIGNGTVKKKRDLFSLFALSPKLELGKVKNDKNKIDDGFVK